MGNITYNVNEQDIHGNTKLMNKVMKRRSYKLIKQSIDKHNVGLIDYTLRNDKDHTLLTLACDFDMIELVSYLLEQKVDIPDNIWNFIQSLPILKKILSMDIDYDHDICLELYINNGKWSMVNYLVTIKPILTAKHILLIHKYALDNKYIIHNIKFSYPFLIESGLTLTEAKILYDKPNNLLFDDMLIQIYEQYFKSPNYNDTLYIWLLCKAESNSVLEKYLLSEIKILFPLKSEQILSQLKNAKIKRKLGEANKSNTLNYITLKK